MGVAASQCAETRGHSWPGGESIVAGIRSSPRCGNASIQCGDRTVLLSEHKWDAKALADWQLIKASSSGDVWSMREALQEGANVDTVRAMRIGFSTPKRIHSRRSDGDEVVVERGRRKPDRVRTLTPLMRAAQGGHDRAVAMLLHAGASLHLQDEDGMHALHLAAGAASLGCCALLLAAGAESTALDDFGRDPFSCLPRECTAFPTQRKRWELLLRSKPDRCQSSISGSDSGTASDEDKREEATFHHPGSFCLRASAPKPQFPNFKTIVL